MREHRATDTDPTTNYKSCFNAGRSRPQSQTSLPGFFVGTPSQCSPNHSRSTYSSPCVLHATPARHPCQSSTRASYAPPLHPALVMVRVEQLNTAAQAACAALEKYEQAFGVPYPLPKLDLVGIPGFAAGAMENYGCIFFRCVWGPGQEGGLVRVAGNILLTLGYNTFTIRTLLTMKVAPLLSWRNSFGHRRARLVSPWLHRFTPYFHSKGHRKHFPRFTGTSAVALPACLPACLPSWMQGIEASGAARAS